MPKRSGGEPSWWSSGDVPAELPSWARRGLEESPTELAPSAPVTDPGRHRRRRGAAAAGAGAGTSGRLRGWGLAAASVAAAAAVVPAAISTLAHNGENTALPRVGTFPVVAPGDLPGQRPPAARPAPGSATEDPFAQPGAPADASVLPPMNDPTVAIAQPPRTATVTPRALARDDDTPSRTTTRPTTGTSTADDDDDEGSTGTSTPTTRGDDDEGGSTGGSGGSGGSSGGGSGSSGSSSGSNGGGSGSSGNSGNSGNSRGGSLLGGVGNAVGGVVNGVGRTVNGLTR
ncbi:hypothetical protein EV188_10861 [Actinomycetospora succinea]|uniref:Uncharacterized protein n=1 Tax=Actinomycetospora succinea TaxID=663603 RepID=A0A4R6UWX2_9PSEU|nr:hypothetical protein [Actinomycetospora succinea]TDQ51701.1 hypothetical protein EV188_10861 [Actinomycetospora succinea]